MTAGQVCLEAVRRQAHSASRPHAGTQVSGRAPLPLSRLGRQLGNCGTHRLLTNIQAKLTVNAPDDEYEREADRVADEVMRRPEPRVSEHFQRVPAAFSRKCASCESEKDKEADAVVQAKAASPPWLHILQRGPAKRAVLPLVPTRAVQAKLTIGPADDEYEREADRAADEVMRTQARAAPGLQRPLPVVQGMCVAREEEALQRRCAPCEEEELQRDPAQPEANGHSPEASPNVATYLAASRGRGAPLSSAARAFFEPRFGQEFSHVRVHTDARAADASHEIRARAFTTGSDIYFASGQYSPGSKAGDRLLCHELTHVVQQQRGSVAPSRRDKDRDVRRARRVANVQPPIRIATGPVSAARLQRDGLSIPTAVPMHGKDSIDPKLLEIARDVRATQAGTTREAFRQINVAAARISVDGEARYISAGNLRSGPHSEEWLDTQIGELRKKHKVVAVEQLYSERIPCKGTCRPLLERKYPSTKVFFTTRRHGNGAATDLIKQYNAKSPKVIRGHGGSSKGKRGGGGAATGRGKAGSRLGKAAKAARRGLTVLGRTAKVALPVLAFLAPIFEVTDALAAFDAAKAKVDELKRKLDAAWEEVEKALQELRKANPPVPIVTPQPAPPQHPPSAPKASHKQAVLVYTVSQRRLLENTLELDRDNLSKAYEDVKFWSLTGVNEHYTIVPPDRYDCPTVLKSGVQGVRKLHEFAGYSRRRDAREVRKILPDQIKTIRALCALAEAARGRSQRSRETTTGTDGDMITVRLDWLVGSLSNSVTATCTGTAGSWNCSDEGSLASLRETTEAEYWPDYQLAVELTRTLAGAVETWRYSISANTPDPEADKQEVTTDGSMPIGMCDDSRYPKESALAYVLAHYGNGCE